MRSRPIRERLGCFQREAEILASLNHPNIAALYDLERANNTTTLVMELVDGPPLSAMAERVVAVSASDAGVIAYRTVSDSERRQLAGFDRNGHEAGRVGRPEYSRDAAPSLSPDGRYIAQESDRGGDWDISLLELARGVSRPLTSDPGWDLAPEWSPDGRRLVFASTRSGVYDLYQQLTTNPEGAELLQGFVPARAV